MKLDMTFSESPERKITVSVELLDGDSFPVIAEEIRNACISFGYMPETVHREFGGGSGYNVFHANFLREVREKGEV